MKSITGTAIYLQMAAMILALVVTGSRREIPQRRHRPNGPPSIPKGTAAAIMNRVERRITQLEKIFFPKPQHEYSFYWEELLFLRDFEKTFPDANTAPDHLRRPYLLLHERCLRGVEHHKRGKAAQHQP